MLDLGESPDKACNIAVIPQNEKDAVLNDCDRDGSAMDSEGEKDHLPARLLNAYAQEQCYQWRWPPPHHHPAPFPLSAVDNEEPRAFASHWGHTNEPRATGATQMSQGQSCRWSKINIEEACHRWDSKTHSIQLKCCRMCKTKLPQPTGCFPTNASTHPKRDQHWKFQPLLHPGQGGATVSDDPYILWDPFHI